MTDYQAISLVLGACALVVSGLALHFSRLAQARAARAEGREVAAEARAEEAHKLALEANERSKRAEAREEAREEEAHHLQKQQMEVQLAILPAQELAHEWMDQLMGKAHAKGQDPNGIVQLKLPWTTTEQRVAVTMLKRQGEEKGIHVEKHDDGVVVAYALASDLLFGPNVS